jgi:recombination protein RecA
MERFSTGCLDLDHVLGGGVPRGRFVEIYGPESGGKSSISLHILAGFQKAYPQEDVAYLDSEFSFDEEYAMALGVNTKQLIVHQPDAGEQALNVLKQLIMLGIGCIVVDSVAALTTKAELEGNLGDMHVGEQARLMSGVLRQLAALAGKRKTTIIWTNQVREKIGQSYGDKLVTPGGRALRHYASIRLMLQRIASEKETIDGEEVIVAIKIKAEAKKNKTSPPFRKAEFYITFGHGIDKVMAVYDMAIRVGVIEKRGSWISMGSEQLGQGRAFVLDNMRKDPTLMTKMEEAVKSKSAGAPVPAPKSDAPDADRESYPHKSPKRPVTGGELVSMADNEEPPAEGAEVTDA